MNKIIYLDAAASYLKPDSVIDAETDFLRHGYANAGRGVCARAAAVDNMVLSARARVARFIGAAPHQIVFTSGATDGLNRVCAMLRGMEKPVVAVSDLDHHSARLPWTLRAAQDGAEIVVMELNKNYDIDISKIPRVDVIVITAMSNVLGRAQNVGAIIAAARTKNPNVISIVDAAQYVVHDEIDVRKWNCDFLCFSGHKIGADTGVGVMYIKNPDDFSPDKFGGGMVKRVTDSDIIFNDAPDKFEAGTLPLTQISGMMPAIDCLVQRRPDLNLVKYMYDELAGISGVKIVTERDAALLTFEVERMHVLDFGALVGAGGVCMRVGNMCASWIHSRLGLNSGSARLSVGAYNTMDDARVAVDVIKRVLK